LNILITGAGGFLGQYLTHNLDQDYTVDARNRAGLDVTDATAVRQTLQSQWYDAVIHCAAEGRNDARAENPTIVAHNLLGFGNLLANRELFGQLINIGTGAEFDLDQDIYRVAEQAIWTRSPRHSYGLSKNCIARLIDGHYDFYNLRIFGCFDASEDDRRPLKRLQSLALQGEPFVIAEDREFDMISAADFAVVVRAGLENRLDYNDINVVYAQKHRLSDILKLYCSTHDIDPGMVQVTGTAKSNYSGDGSRLAYNDIALQGLKNSIKNYGISQ